MLFFIAFPDRNSTIKSLRSKCPGSSVGQSAGFLSTPDTIPHRTISRAIPDVRVGCANCELARDCACAQVLSINVSRARHGIPYRQQGDKGGENGTGIPGGT